MKNIDAKELSNTIACKNINSLVIFFDKYCVLITKSLKNTNNENKYFCADF